MSKVAIRRIRELKTNVAKTNITKRVLETLDKFWETRAATSYPKLMKTFSSAMIKQLDLKTIKKIKHNTTHHTFHVSLTESQILCRDTIRSIFSIKKNRAIRRTIAKYYAKKKGNKKNNIDQIHKGVHETLKFLTRNIIRSVIFFLVITITGTLLIEAKTIFFDFYRSNQIPLISNLKLKWQENDPNSPLIAKDENCSNKYVLEASKRNNFNIKEATHETLSAINIQIALWVYLSAFLGIMKRYLNKSFAIDATNKDLGLRNGDFTDFGQSAMKTSLLGGII